MGYRSAVEVLAASVRRPVWDEAAGTTRELVRCSFRDWVAVAIAGAAEPEVAGIAELTATAARDETMSATVIVAGRRVSVGDAAFVNGFCGHVLDFDDTSTGPFEGHPSAVVVPPLLAVAELQGAQLRDVFSAYASGVQVAHDLGTWVSPRHYAQGWHATATVGSIGAAAAAARLLGLSSDEIGNAIALASTQAAGVRSAFGTLAKPLQVGRACAVAVDSALMASVGVTGPLSVLDEHPLFEALRDRVEPTAELSIAGDDATAVEQTLIKWHAACHSTHPALEAVALLAVPEENLEWVEVGVRPDVLDVCGIEQPATPLELKFSVRGVVAMAIAGIDTSDPASYGRTTLTSSEWKSALHKVRVDPVGLPSEWQTTVTVGVTGQQPRAVTADLRDRLTVADTERRAADKFDRLVRPVLGSGPADDLWKLLSDPDDVTVADLMSATKVGR